MLLTIYVVTYNRYNYLLKTIKSILNQTFNDYKIVILDNCSTDRQYLNFSKVFNHPSISYKRHSKNLGFFGNANFAINDAKTKYFMIFHDDDIMKKNMIETQMKVFYDNPDLAMVSSKSDYIDENGNNINNLNSLSGLRKSKLYNDNSYIINYFNNNTDILCPSVIFNTNFFKKKSIYFSEEAGPAADQLMWFEVLRNNGKILVLDEILFTYRIHTKQISNETKFSMDLDLVIYLSRNDFYYKFLSQASKKFKKKMIMNLAFLKIRKSRNFTYYKNKYFSIFPSRLNSYFLFIFFHYITFKVIIKKILLSTHPKRIY